VWFRIGFVGHHEARISESHLLDYRQIDHWHIVQRHIDHGPTVTDRGATGGGVRRSGRR
jgi:hypothetical protein